MCRLFGLFRRNFYPPAQLTSKDAQRRAAKSHFGLLTGAVLWACASVLTTYTSATAQSAPKVTILHKTPDARSLPLTSNWMPIAVELANTKATDLKIRLVGARDGRFIDIALPAGALNEEDRPLYKVEVPAPAATMSYQFIVHQPDGQLSTTKRFTIQRPCVQNFKVEVAGDDSDAQFRREVSELVAKAKVYERDRANLDAAAKVVEEIRLNLPG